MKNFIQKDVMALKNEIISLRRDFHAWPELGLKEFQTAEKIKLFLTEYGIEILEGGLETAVVGMIHGKGPGRTLMLRADMDALPIQEENQVAYCSKNDGVMHACGHDGHMAILLTAAKILKNRSSEFPGKIKLVFQPAEENAAGAFFMIHEGVLDQPKVDAAMGLHLFTTMPVGKVGACENQTMASVDMFTITIHGKGGHGSEPTDGVDAILIAGHVVTALQSLVSREVSAKDKAVIHIGTINGGTAVNIIADEVTLTGSVRTLNETVRRRIKKRMGDIVSGVAEAMNGKAEFKYQDGYPVLNNDPVMTRLVNDAAVEVVGKKNNMIPSPMMGSEDMAFFLENVPGCFFFVGAGNDEKNLVAPHHSSQFDFDEDALGIGTQTLVQAAISYLASN